MLNTRFFDEMDDFRRSFEQLFDSVSRPVQKGGRNSSEWYFVPPVETGWTEAKVYAGETVKLRGKTAYLSAYMDVKFVSVYGDDGATVYARNKLVSW